MAFYAFQERAIDIEGELKASKEIARGGLARRRALEEEDEGDEGILQGNEGKILEGIVVPSQGKVKGSGRLG